MNFFKLFWIVVLGCIVSSILGFILWMIVIFAFAGSLAMSETVVAKPNSVLKIDLSESFTESPQSNPMANFNFNTLEMGQSITLFDTLSAIEAAADDDNIEAIYLNISSSSMVPTAALEEIREALAEFKLSGKSIIAYNTSYSQKGYYLSTVADKVYVQPEGMLIWQGMASNTMFYKGLLDKLGIEVQVFRPTVCRYKSAVEPYILDKMSSANRTQMEQLISSMWEVIASDVAVARGLTLEEVNRIADNLDCMDVDTALECRMVDGLIYEDQLTAILEEAGVKVDETEQSVNYISLSDYISLQGEALSSFGADKIAIIYAEGSIVDGEGSDGKIYGNSTASTIRKARKDDSIKAVVLRVNSPGGSALASDIMWRELDLLRSEKPLIVSMGSYAASGGYYISAPADVILADRLTLTGSIGVFGMIPNVESACEDKLGITFDGVETNSSAAFMTSLSALSSYEHNVMIKSVDKVYERFTSLVAEGRNLPLEDVLEIAQGRVWSGDEAVELGLADAIGGLKAAIAVAQDKAGLEEFRLVEMTEEPTGFAALFAQVRATISNAINTKNPMAKNPLLKEYEAVRSAIEPIYSEQGLVMYSPYRIEI
ncbi:MAG: signal peptide peptidase SppA [Rikenellaceae bacterium]